MKCKQKRMYYSLFLIFLCLMMMFTSFYTIQSVYAEDTTEIVYTDVLEDLQKDISFDVSLYPVIENDYSLQVIQIAESVNNELFIYVYQPSGQVGNLVATELRMSTDIDENAVFNDYSLQLLNSNDTLFKYKVENFTVKSDAMRNYNIVCIFRAWNGEYDESAPGDNVINYVSFDVSKLWTVKTVNGRISYFCYETQTIEITDKYVGFVRYPNGFWNFGDSCDSHFVAFSTNLPMDKLLEVEISYVRTPTCKRYAPLTGWHDVIDDYYGVPIFEEKTINDTDVATNNPFWLGGKSYSWKRIESVSEFLQDKNVFGEEEMREQLKDKQWVLRFAETTYDIIGTSYVVQDNIDEVSILKLTFETDGVVYGLGVVDNKQSGDHTPVNSPKSVWEWIVLGLVCLFAFVLILVFFPSIIIFVFKIVWNIICYVLKGIWWLITAPFSIFFDD